MFVQSYALFLGDKFRNEISSHILVTKADSITHTQERCSCWVLYSQKKMPVYSMPWNTWNIC
jgi:hypothetical protein